MAPSSTEPNSQPAAGIGTVDVLCSHEGEEYKTTGTMRIEKVAGADAYSIVDEDGSQWGAVGPCD